MNPITTNTTVTVDEEMSYQDLFLLRLEIICATLSLRVCILISHGRTIEEKSCQI